MKLKDGFIIRDVAGQTVALFSGDDLDFENEIIINLNSTAAFLWRLLETEQTRESLLAEVMKTYTVEEEKALAAIDAFLAEMREKNFLTE